MTSLLIAYLAGLLSFFAPCGAVLLPSFFANAFKTRASLLVATGWFMLGFLTLFAPVGLGVRSVTRTLLLHRETFSLAGGIVFFGLAILALLGKGLHVPVPKFLSSRGFHHDGLSAYLIGVVFGFTVAGCTAPLLGLTLTLSLLAKGSALHFAILAVYALGIATPLFALAFVADRAGFLRKPFLKGRAWTFRLAGKERMLHSTNALSAVALVAIGTVFIASKGTFFAEHLGGTQRFFADFNAGAADVLAGWKYGK